MKKAYDIVSKYIDDHREELFSLLSDMVRIPSVNNHFEDKDEYKGEGNVQRFIKEYEEKTIGIPAEFTWPNSDNLASHKGKAGYYQGRKFDDRPNCCAKLEGTGGGKSLLLSGHTDVVSVGIGWETDPFDPIVKDGFMFGRGTSDMKGGIASMLIAIEAIKKTGIKLKGDILMGTTVDEEAGSMGTLAFVEEGYKADACIIGEGTHQDINAMCRGILWAKIHVPGRAGHIELAPKSWHGGGAVDAIEKATIIMDALDILNDEWKITRTHPLLPANLPCQVLIAQVEAGDYATSYADSAVITVNAQYLPSERDNDHLGSWLKDQLTTFISKVADTDPWMKENPPYIEWEIDANCAETSVSDPFIKSIFSSYDEVGFDTKVKGSGGHDDMEFFCAKGMPTINLGPGDGATNHQPNECIWMEDLVDCAKRIAAIALGWCEISE